MQAELVLVRSTNAAVGHGLLHSLFRSARGTPDRAAVDPGTFGDLQAMVGYRSRDLRHPLGDVLDQCALGLWRQLQQLPDVAALRSREPMSATC